MIRRIKLATQRVAPTRPAPELRLLLREASYPLSPLTRRLHRQPQISQAADPKVVMVLPGFLAHPITMSYLSRQIERAGHQAKQWGIGLNLGASEERMRRLEHRLDELFRKHEKPIVLLGWSLGGILARELAKRRAHQVAKVITMGSPFSGDPRENNAWRLYQFVAGHAVDDPPIESELSVKPPVETVALWSPRDGIVSPRSAAGRPGERDRAIATRTTHMGFSYSAEAVEKVVNELDEQQVIKRNYL